MTSDKFVFSGRILCFICAAYMMGIALCAFFNIPVAAIAATVFVFLLAAYFKKLPCIFAVMLCCLSFMGGVLQFNIATAKINRFTNKYSGRYVTVSGRISEIDDAGEEKQKLTVSADSISALGKREARSFTAVIYTDRNKNFRVGEKISFSALFKPFIKSGEHYFDYARHLNTKGISASFFLSSDKLNTMFGNPSFTEKVRLMSSYLSARLNATIRGDEGDVACAILLGDRSGISDSLSDVFTKSGISHIIAVSGMHLSILSGFFFSLATRTRLHYKLRNILGIIIVLAYMTITGFSPSVVRASIMTICTLMAAVMDRKEDIPTSFFLSAAIILVFNPYTIYSASFLLSYSALAGILIFRKPLLVHAEKIGFIPSFITDIAVTTFSASILTLPVLVYMFNEISIVSIITNILVVPLVSLVFILLLVTLILILIYPPVGGLFALIPKFLISMILAVAKWTASIPYAHPNIKTPTLPMVLCFAAVVTLFYFVIKGKKLGTFGRLVSVAVVTVAVVSFGISYSTSSVTFLSVGQGDCVLIRMAGGKTCLVDTGVNGKASLSALKSYGVNRLDTIFISHSDKDHCGGLKDILRDIQTDRVVLPNYDIFSNETRELIEIATSNGADVEFADSFSGYRIGEAEFDALWPRRDKMPENSNSASMVIAADIKGTRFLFTGDIDENAESGIIESGEFVGADVLKVSHHGSKSSSSDDFLKKVSADYSVISAGVENSYGHPHEETLLRLENSGSTVLRTDLSGDIGFTIDLFGNMRVKYETD